MSLSSVAGAAAGWSRAMNATAAKLSDPEVVKDPGKLAIVNMEMFQNTTGYELSARAMQTLNREDQLLSELLANP